MTCPVLAMMYAGLSGWVSAIAPGHMANSSCRPEFLTSGTWRVGRAGVYGCPMAIISWGTYVPESRLDRGLITAALGTPAGSGTRSVASFDEDTTTMGVEAARNALANLPSELMPQAVLFATANPAYLDKTNATAIHAALGLPSSVRAFDVGGAVRSG